MIFEIFSVCEIHGSGALEESSGFILTTSPWEGLTGPRMRKLVRGKDLPKIWALRLGGVGSGRSNQPPFLTRPGPLRWMEGLLRPSQHRSGHLDIGHEFKSARPSPGLPSWCPPQPVATPIKLRSPTLPHLWPTKQPEIPGTGIAQTYPSWPRRPMGLPSRARLRPSTVGTWPGLVSRGVLGQAARAAGSPLS